LCTLRHTHDTFGIFHDMHSSGLHPTAPSLCVVLCTIGARAAAHAQTMVLGFLTNNVVPTVLL
jgi:pentatricopeptide repeat protein